MTVDQLGKAVVATCAAMVALAGFLLWLARELDRGTTLPAPSKSGWLR